MTQPTTDPRLVNWSSAFYQILLVTYPTRFRQEYGAHMQQVFRDCCRKAYRTGGLPGMLWLWALTSFDYFKSLIEEHSQRGVHMSKEKFVRISAWSLILAAFTFILGWAVGFVQPYDPYNALVSPVQKYLQVIDGSEEILLPFAIFLISLGCLGYYLRYARQAGRSAKAGLAVSVGGSALALAAILLLTISRIEYLWGGIVVGMLLLFGGMVLFGAAAVKFQILPRWNFTPLAVGLCGLPAVLGLGDILIVPTGIGFFVLGFLLQSDAKLTSQASAV